MDLLAADRGRVLLFEYGTLMHRDQPPKTEDAWRPATITGTMHDFGDYKGVTDIGKTDAKVVGEVGEIDPKELDVLDRREDVAKGDYRRVRTKTTDGQDCWVYEYTGDRLAKGQHGDWQQEGYRLKAVHDSDPRANTFYVHAYDKAGVHAGQVKVAHHVDGQHVYPAATVTNFRHRRKGLASAMYRLAEQTAGKKMRPESGYTFQTEAARKLWADPNRQFGKSLAKSDDYRPWSGDEIAGYIENNADPVQHDPKHPAARAEQNPEWTHESVPIEKIKSDYLRGRGLENPAGWSAWWKTELKDPENQYRGLQAQYLREPRDMPVIVHQGADGMYYLNDGHHRMGIAHLKGMKLVPALVGRARKIKRLTKAAPSRPGQIDEQKGNVAVRHHQNPNVLVWAHGPEKAKHFTDQVANTMPTFLAQHGNDPVLTRALTAIARHPRRHYVPTQTGQAEPRLRHLAYLTGGHPSATLHGMGPGEYLWSQQRHPGGGEVESVDPGRHETLWHINSQGVHDVTARRKEFAKVLQKSADKTSYAGGQHGRTTTHSGQNANRNDRTGAADRGQILRVRRLGRLLRRSSGRVPPARLIGRLSKSDKQTPNVATVAVIDGNRLLMGRRNDNGRWTCPGGHLDHGESPEQAALRELHEESGIHGVKLYQIGHEHVVCDDGQARNIYCYVTFGRPETTGEFDPDEEVQKWEWIDMSKGLPDQIKNRLHAKKNVLMKLLGLLPETASDC